MKKVNTTKMREYDFTLIYKLTNDKDEPSKYLDALFEAGCDDALVAIGKKGMISLDFTREEKNAQSAMMSAMEDVKKAIPKSVLVETSPDYVTATELGKILNHSRQNARKLMIKKNSPSPVHIGSPSFWHLSEVLNWLKEENNISNYGVEETLIQVANMTKKINYTIKQPEEMIKIDKKIKELVI